MANQEVNKSPSTVTMQDECKPIKRLNSLERLKKIQKQVLVCKRELEEEIHDLENMEFKPGDFAIHRKYGNCVVMDYVVDFYRFDPITEYEFAKKEDTKTGYRISTAGYGEIFAHEKDLLPANDTTKVLYNKSGAK